MLKLSTKWHLLHKIWVFFSWIINDSNKNCLIKIKDANQNSKYHQFWLTISCSSLINNYIHSYIRYVVDEDSHLVMCPKNLLGSSCSQWLLQVDLVPQGPFWFIAFPMAILCDKEPTLGTQWTKKAPN
jgi:hypothetical protein